MPKSTLLNSGRKLIHAWLQLATKEERMLLARKAKTSVGYLYQLAGGHRNCGPALAVRLDRFSRELREKNSLLPVLSRTVLCPKVFDGRNEPGISG